MRYIVKEVNWGLFKGRLDELRRQKKISQAELSKRIGIARTTYSGYENGTREPDHATLEKLADFFDVSIDYLLGRSNEKRPINTVTNDAKTTIKLIEDEANRLGLSPTDPAFKKMLSDAFDLLRLARGKNNE